MSDEINVDTGAAQATPSPTPEAPAATSEPSQEQPTTTTTEPAPAEFKVRDEYKDKPWASKIKSEDDLWKTLDNAQSLIGKKTVAPDFEKATPAEIEDYYNQIRPADAAEYSKSLQFSDDVPEADKSFITDLLHKNGVGAHQANEIIKNYLEHQSGQVAALYDKDGFMKELETSFGKDYEKTAGEVAKVIAQHTNKEDKAILEQLPNSALGLIYRTIGNLQKAYGVNESGLGGEAPSKIPTQDINEVRSSIRKEMHELVKRNHTAEEKARLQARLDATYKGTK